MDKRQVFYKWVRATWTGWVLGIPFIIALALVAEAAGIGGAQVPVGLGMGTGIGLMQARAIRSVGPKAALWFWSCVIGLGVPFLATDIANAAGYEVTFSLYLSVALGGLMVGILQAFILRPNLHHRVWWVTGSLVGWAMASSMVAVAESLSRIRPLRGLWGAFAFLGTVAGGGLVLGVITAVSLVRVLRN